MTTDDRAVFWFEDVDCRSVNTAGGKGASLASMTAEGLPVPPGFVISADALVAALDASGRLEELKSVLGGIDGDEAAATAAVELQQLVVDSAPEGAVADAILSAYEELDGGGDVAVRSSARAEDGEQASYAGQQETYLNVRGADQVLQSVVRCWASFFGERALFYRKRKGSLDDLGMAVVVQRQLDPVKSGVMFTIDPVRRRRDQMVIEAAWGLGEAVVSGAVIPDQYVVGRNGALKKVTVSQKKLKVVRGSAGGIEEVELDAEEATAQVLDEAELEALAAMGIRAEEVFGGPQDVEWAITDDLYLLQSRPVTA